MFLGFIHQVLEQRTNILVKIAVWWSCSYINCIIDSSYSNILGYYERIKGFVGFLIYFISYMSTTAGGDIS